jgi:maltooligosyltrehalose trehalohydrolase
MNGAADGWFSAATPLGRGADYAFRLDGGDPLPDPRSAWQPHGPSAPSRTVDHAGFAWTDRGWTAPELGDSILYELHVGTFTPEGTFDGVISKLDHLVQLGVTAVELMPVAEFSGVRNWGYDGVDLFAPHHAYGGPAGLKRLVDACHRRGLAVILDVVYNHLGPVANYLERYGPYFTDRYQTPWGKAINFDGPESDSVRQFFLDNAAMWLRDYHLDGLRLDAVHAIIDASALPIVEELALRVDELAEQLGRRLWVIAESDRNDPRLCVHRDQGGYGLDAQWSDDFHHALHAVLTGERHGYYQDFGTLSDVATALRQAYVYDGRYSAFRRRRHGRRPTGLTGNCFLGYLQNHDQVGNRARGERSAALMSRGRLKIGAALVLMAPFVPLLFMGEEWAAATPFPFFSDHQDPSVARATTEGRLREFAAFGWDPAQVPDPQQPATFESAKLRWEEVSQPEHAEVLDWHRRLLVLRRQSPELRDGRLDRVEVRLDEKAGWLSLRRGASALACNISPQARLVPVGPGELLLGSEPGITREPDGVRLPADSVAVVRAPA